MPSPITWPAASPSLDHLSGGRAGWNVVTTAYSKSSAVFGRQHPPHAERYAMAEEFVEACRAAVGQLGRRRLHRRQEGRRLRCGRAASHVPAISRKYFTVEGLNVPRSPQNHPVLIQAGSSGARPGAGRAHRRRGVHRPKRPRPRRSPPTRREGPGRPGSGAPPTQVLVMPGVMPVVGRTEARGAGDLRRAQPQHQHRTGLHRAVGAAGRGHVRSIRWTGRSRTPPQTEHLKSRAAAADGRWRGARTSPCASSTTASAARAASAAGRRRCRSPTCWSLVPHRRRRRLQCHAAVLPGQFDAFAQGVVPILQERGLFRADYAGTTLRGTSRIGAPL